MADETLSFNILGRDGASSAFRRVGDSADYAAKGTRRAADELDRQRGAADGAAAATLRAAAADRVLGAAASRATGDLSRADYTLRRFGSGPGAPGKGGFFGKLLGGAGPGIFGLSPKMLTILSGGLVGLGALPALTAITATAGVAGLAGKVLIGSKYNQGPLYAEFKKATSSFTTAFDQAAKGLEKPLKHVFDQIPKFVSQITPELKRLFAAVGPLIGPLVKAFELLIKGILPGLIVMLRAARPALSAFAQVLGAIGRDLGQMFKIFAPVMRQSAAIFKALFDVVSGLFPVIGKLAAIMAHTLAPIFRDLAGVVRKLEPFLVVLGHALAALAGAVLKDLVAVFGALATLLKDIAPSFAGLAKTLGLIFNTMENAGLFAVLGDALEKLAPALAKLINALVSGLAPILPPIFIAIGKVSAALTGALVKAILAMIPGLTRFIALFAKTLREITPLIPTLTKLNLMLINLLVKAIVPLLPGVTKFLDLLIKIQSETAPYVIKLIIAMTKALFPAIQAFTNIVGAVSSFIGWLFTLVSKLQNFKGVWRSITGFLQSAWSTAWGVIKTVASNAWQWIQQHVINPLKSAYNFLKSVASFFTGGGPGGGGGSANMTPGQAQNYAAGQLQSHGWTSREFPSLVNLWNRESGWNRLARNASGAYGIPQGLPASKMGAAANPPTSSAKAQVDWGLGYIKGRYGTPSGAWAWELSHGWYDKGGLLRPGLNLAYNGTGGNERVIGPAQEAAELALLRELVSLLQRLIGVEARQPAGLAGALNNTARASAYKMLYSARG